MKYLLCILLWIFKLQIASLICDKIHEWWFSHSMLIDWLRILDQLEKWSIYYVFCCEFSSYKLLHLFVIKFTNGDFLILCWLIDWLRILDQLEKWSIYYVFCCEFSSYKLFHLFVIKFTDGLFKFYVDSKFCSISSKY